MVKLYRRAAPCTWALSLRGGVHFLLQVDMKAALNKKLDTTVNDIRSTLRDKRIRSSGVTRDRDSVTVRFRDKDARDKGLSEIDKVIADLLLRTQDDAAAGEYRITAALKPEAEKRTQKSALEQNITTLRNRVNELGVAEPIIQQQGADRIVVQLPGVQDTARAKDILGRTASLEVRMVEAHASDPDARDYDPQKIDAAVKAPFHSAPNCSSSAAVSESNRCCSPKTWCSPANGSPMPRRRSISRITDRWLSVELDGQGARIMRDVTREAVKRRMAILLIEKGKPEVITAPTIQSELGGRFQITGSNTPREASDLALLLRAGALAAPMDIVEERTVGPSLGAENIRIGFHSTLYGFAGDRGIHDRVLPAVRRDLGHRARLQPAVSDSAAVDAAGDADAARHGRDRAHAGHGDRRQRADQRAHTRGTAETATRRRPRSTRATSARGARFSIPTSRR